MLKRVRVAFLFFFTMKDNMDMPQTKKETGSMSYGKEENGHFLLYFSHDKPQLIGQRTSESADGTCLHKLRTICSCVALALRFSEEDRWWIENVVLA